MGDGLQREVSLDVWLPSGCLDLFGERKMMGSMFSELETSDASCSKVVALRLEGEVRVVRAREVVRFGVII